MANNLVITQEGVVPTPPQVIREQIQSEIENTVPDYTASLPGTLIEDLLSTCCGCAVFIEQAKVDLINSISPSTANEALLDQLGVVYGIIRKSGSSGSAYVVFTGTAGFIVPRGFIISDGIHRFIVQNDTVINQEGSSGQVYVLAQDTSVFDIPANTITKIESSVRNDIKLTVTNPQIGIIGSKAESYADYRARIMNAGIVTSTATPTMIRTKLLAIPNVQQRLLSIIANGDGYSVICGGGDPYDVANAIFQSIPTTGILKPSVIDVSRFDKGNPTVMYTNLIHGLKDGDLVTFSGLGFNDLQNKRFKAKILTANSFSIPVDTTNFSDYTGGLILNQNIRNRSIILRDGVDSYTIPFVVPLQQQVEVQLIWNTDVESSLYVGAISNTTIPLIVQYINGISIGDSINLYEVEKIFLEGVNQVVNQNLVTNIEILIFIDGVQQEPLPKENIIRGDPQSYFYTTEEKIVVTDGK
ncbi:baseplate J/gp47 family protein [Commensalibacter nepenthis]|uniref:Baseplate J/gp47 family protein n=1 Tax=Commensalibacter nepenthis TaxID=3043872 RepID=A0ABT6Q856_9PROT|nr:baseplate J/gp47 family protein [Commensalibacter sp. TBRC 10068]MDI2113090.1 baseplate J/gp47 family protein [Commensalibacter sp. TBRC 10068]